MRNHARRANRTAAIHGAGRRPRTTRLIAMLGTVLSAGLVLAGCSNPGATQGGSGGSLPTDGTAKVQSKQLTVWVNPADSTAVMNVYKRYTAATGVKFNIIKMPTTGYEQAVNTRWASGDRPDLLEYHGTSLFWSLNPPQTLFDLSKMPFVKREQDILKTDGSFQGKVYAAVTDTPTLYGLFYNKAVLAKAGAQAPKTYSDLQNLCTTLKQKASGVTPIFESGGSSWPTQILAGIMYMASVQKDTNWEQQILSKKTTFGASGSPFVAGLTEYKKLQTMGCFNRDATTAQFQTGIADIVKGKAAMMALPTSLLDMIIAQDGNSAEKTNQDIGFAYPSASAAVAPWSSNVGGTWFVPKTGNTAKESTALAFIQWATTKGYQGFVNEEGLTPVLSGAQTPSSASSGLNKEFADAYQNSSSSAFNGNLSGFNAQFNNYVTGLLSGQQTPQGIAETSQTVFEQAARAAKLPGWK